MSQAGKVQYRCLSVHYVNYNDDAQIEYATAKQRTDSEIRYTFITYQGNGTDAGYQFGHGGNNPEEKHPYPDSAESGLIGNNIGIPGCLCPGNEDYDNAQQELNPDQ
jgi:hypothetical protein